MTSAGIQLSRIKKQPRRNFIAERLVLGATLMTLYGFVTVQIQNAYFWLVLLVFQFVPSVYYFIQYFNAFMEVSDMDRALGND